jgi:hypothetical protein
VVGTALPHSLGVRCSAGSPFWSPYWYRYGAELEVIMDSIEQRIAVVRGAFGAQVQEVFRALAERWRHSVRLVGLIAEDHGFTDRACSAGFLRNIRSGERFSIFEDLGPGSTACHLDGAGAFAAADAVRRDIVAGCDLVLLSKFGKLEANGKGLLGAFRAALDVHIPLLTSISPAFEEPWKRLAGQSFGILPADPDALDAWWQAVRKMPPQSPSLQY